MLGLNNVLVVVNCSDRIYVCRFLFLIFCFKVEDIFLRGKGKRKKLGRRKLILFIIEIFRIRNIIILREEYGGGFL